MEEVTLFLEWWLNGCLRVRHWENVKELGISQLNVHILRFIDPEINQLVVLSGGNFLISKDTEDANQSNN